MLQLENEYFGAFWMAHSARYLRYLHTITRESGFAQLLFTSDPGFAARQLPTKEIFPQDSSTHFVLETANLNQDALATLLDLKQHQPNRPVMVSEFWPGWFDSWNETGHHRYPVEQFEREVSDILFTMNGSVNFYMFMGGTNFGFTNGARVVTSYDYDAPLSESGNYTPKYYKTLELYHKLVDTGRMPKTHIPEVPKAPAVHGYGNVSITSMLPLESLLQHAVKFTNVPKPIPMELLDVGKDYGQNFGFILYRVEVDEEVKKYEVTGKDRRRNWN